MASSRQKLVASFTQQNVPPRARKRVKPKDVTVERFDPKRGFYDARFSGDPLYRSPQQAKGAGIPQRQFSSTGWGRTPGPVRVKPRRRIKRY